MSDTHTTDTPALTKDDLLRDSAFVDRWNRGDPAAIRQLHAVTVAQVAGGGGADDRPRPANAGGENTLLSAAEARQLAQASVDAGGDIAQIKAAMADTDPDWTPDLRPKADRDHAERTEPGHPERYSTMSLDRHFANDDPAERGALGDVFRSAVASVGYDRSAGTDLIEQMAAAAAETRGLRPDARSLYQQRQAAMLGARRDELVRDAAASVALMPAGVRDLLHKSGVLDAASVIMALAFAHQSRRAG